MKKVEKVAKEAKEAKEAKPLKADQMKAEKLMKQMEEQNKELKEKVIDLNEKLENQKKLVAQHAKQMAPQRCNIQDLQETTQNLREMIDRQNNLMERVDKEMTDLCEEVRKLHKITDENTVRIKNFKENPVPFGFIYIQMPNQLDPQILFRRLHWENVSHRLAGLYFRVEGKGDPPAVRGQEEHTNGFGNCLGANQCVRLWRRI